MFKEKYFLIFKKRAHQQTFENLIYQIYRYQDAELGRAFCEALVSNQQENSFLSKQTLKAIFLGLSIQQGKNLFY